MLSDLLLRMPTPRFPTLRIPIPRFALGMLLGLTLGVVLGSAPVRAQLTVVPQSLSVMVPQHATETRTVTLTNSGSEPLSFCLSFERPLQRTAGDAVRLGSGALGGACGPYGEVLFLIDRDDLPGCCANPVGLTMTADGRLFGAEYHTDLTYELDAALNYVRTFEHPVVAELEPFPATTGVTYNADTGTLWWLNIEELQSGIRRALLLEGDLDGEPTGRRIELPIGFPDVPPDERVLPSGLVYDTATKRYYYVDFRGNAVWAVDTLGAVVEGYPVELEAYPGVQLGFGLDAHSTGEDGAGTGGEGLRFEVATALPGQPGLRRIVVADALGGDTAPGGAEPLMTPLSEPLPGTGSGGMGGEPVRSRLDPNGVLYYPWSDFDNSGLVAVRPHPLPPSWLVVEAWRGTLAPGESREVALTFRPGARAVGEYTASLQAFEAATGAAVEVPLVLTVTEGTDAEEEGAVPARSALSVYPNPSFGDATVALSLSDASDVRVAVYDVLGRRVALLAEARLEAGTHRLLLDRRSLPSGVYIVRVAVEGGRGAGRVFDQKLTLLK